MKYPVLLTSAICCLLSSCAKQSEIEQLRKDLGDIQYYSREPQLQLRVLAGEWIAPANEYESVKYRFRGVVNELAPFPVKEYLIYIRYTVTDAQGISPDGDARVKIINGSGAFEAEVAFYKEKPTASSQTKKPAIKVNGFNWIPETKHSLKTLDDRK